jgi:predicted site-specific integrase-resolvase
VNLKEWATSTGIAYITARRQYAAGTLPVPTYRIGRLIMVGEPVTGVATDTGQAVVYARVSSADQKPDLDRQVARVTVWATGQKLALTAQGRRLLVVDPAEVDDDLVRDVTEILTSLCARLYGRRAAANRARRAVEAATGEPA